VRRRAARSRALASLICSSESAIDAYLAFALAEAKALVIQHRDAVLAVANALMVHRTLDAVEIHKIVALAPERARRADWKIVEKNAANFAAQGLESWMAGPERPRGCSTGKISLDSSSILSPVPGR
jgi:hypothetical protein